MTASPSEIIPTLIIALFALTMLFFIVVGVLSSISVTANNKAVIEEIETQGAEVIGGNIVSGEVLLRFGEDQIVPCDVDYRIDGDTPTGFVSCASEQGASVLPVEVPYSTNVFDFKNYLNEN